MDILQSKPDFAAGLESLVGTNGLHDRQINDEPANPLYGDDVVVEKLTRAGKLAKIEGSFLLRWGGQIIQGPSQGVLNDLLGLANGDHELVIACVAKAPTALKYQTPRSAANLVTKILKQRMPDPEIEARIQKERDEKNAVDEYGYYVNKGWASETSWHPYMGYGRQGELIKLLMTAQVPYIDVCNYIETLKPDTKIPDVLDKVIKHFLPEHKNA